MQTMNVSLPDQLKEFVDKQVISRHYSSVSEYVRDLIREDERCEAQKTLEALLLEGVRSSQPSKMTRRNWNDIRRQALKQLEGQKARKTA